jgi:RNA recognition motif-containing protein
LDQQPQGLPSFALPGLGSGHPNQGLGQHSQRQDNFSHEVDEELIPTAIVIKNIPFAVKKEQLVQLMTDLRLPLPYAFNYHFDNGVFRGLAFANFTTAEETASVIDTMNHFELHGRKLRVEYKKMLPLAERERIEREKRERRGQLEEQHRPMGGGLQTQPSFGSLASHIPATSPSPVSALRPSNLGMCSQHFCLILTNKIRCRCGP